INVERYLAGEMPPREAAIFLAEVQRDPEALAYLGKVLRQQALLFTLQRQEAGQQSGRNFAAGGVLPWTGGRLAWAAALFLVVSAAGWILWRQVAVPAVVAQVETVTGKVQVEQAGRTDKSTVTAGQALHAGERLLTTAADSTAVIVFPDGTRLQVEGQTELRLPQAGPAKRVWLEQGEIAATVVKQPGGQPMVLETALTETRVLGTRFHLTSKPGVTRLVVD